MFSDSFSNDWLSGWFSEKVNIPLAKKYIFLQGESHKTTHIRYGDARNARTAATFQLYADNFAASGITFQVNRLDKICISLDLSCFAWRCLLRFTIVPELE